MTATNELSFDERLEMHNAAKRLRTEFNGVFWHETVERFLETSYGQVAAHDSDVFLPLLAERFARQRLQALAHVNGDGRDGKPAALFMCVRDAARSQMALGFFRHLAGDRAMAWSAGCTPDDEITPAVIAAMNERGVDITAEFPKPWTNEILRAADVVIIMGVPESPVYPRMRQREWEIDDATGLPLEELRPIRDKIEQHVRDLVVELGVAQLVERS